jgi:uncharacterized protein (DUF4415 family)
MSGDEKRAIAEADEENPKWTQAAIEEAELVVPGEGRRIPVSIRLSARVLVWFKRLGSGYQTRINQVLVDYVDEETRKSKRQIDWSPISKAQTEYRMKGKTWDMTAVAPSPHQDRSRTRTPEYA